MNMKRRGQIGSWILMIAAVTFAGIAAVNFFRGVDQGAGTIDAGRAQIAQVSATIGVAFALVAVAIGVTFRDG
jgi:hypothetical protein